MEIYYKHNDYTVPDDDVELIDFLGIKTPKAKLHTPIEIFWNPLDWEWTPVSDIPRINKKYEGNVKDVYFKEKIFLVEISTIRKDYSNMIEDFVDIVKLPIGIEVFWNGLSEDWEFWEETDHK